jgi:hypothetical protein
MRIIDPEKEKVALSYVKEHGLYGALAGAGVGGLLNSYGNRRISWYSHMKPQFKFFILTMSKHLVLNLHT